MAWLDVLWWCPPVITRLGNGTGLPFSVLYTVSPQVIRHMQRQPVQRGSPANHVTQIASGGASAQNLTRIEERARSH
ncbi:hypothetical protein [Escherichia coli]|uniref:hypothetical protein n=1 Tax=Escherichia coli TaxID=562 RepID=UPI0034DDC751